MSKQPVKMTKEEWRAFYPVTNVVEDQNVYDSGVFLALDELLKVCGYFDFNADDYVCTHENPPDRFDDGKGMCMSSSCPVANSVNEPIGCDGDTSMQVYDPIVISRISDKGGSK